METRFRWLKVEPLSRRHLAVVATAMQTSRYSRDSQSGFVLDMVRADLIEGTFIERFQFVEKFPDLLGGQVSLDRIEFRQTHFRLAIDYPQLELRDPSRSVKTLLNYIAGALDYKVAISSVEIQPLDWVSSIEAAGAKIKVLALRTNRFPVSNAVAGIIQLVGTQEVRNYLLTLTGKRKVNIDGLQCMWSTDAGEWKADLRLGGSARILSSPNAKSGLPFRDAIANAITKG